MQISNITQGGQNNYNTTIRMSENTSSVEAIKPIKLSKSNINSNENNKNNAEENLSEEDVKFATDKLNKLLEGESSHAEYSFHETFHQLMIKIVNDDTNEVISELPPKKILDGIAALCESLGLFVDKKA